MIPNKNSTSQVTHNLDGETFEMDIDSTNVWFVIDSLTNLYKRPPAAVLREYSTNAHDSHIVAGIDKPIEVTLPTRENPVLSIKDFGVGMSKDDINATYRLYAASTKRETNDLNGVLGLGSKSALAYTDQFTVIGRKDGIKTTVAIIRSEEGGRNKVVVVSEEPIPADDTGVEVLIPANTKDKWQELADKLYRFWPEGSVLVNGAKPKQLKGGINVTDNIVAYNKYAQRHAESVKLEEDYIVMGNVGYPIDDEFSNGTTRLVIYVENGDVDFVPSREGLRDTPLTKASLAATKNEYRKGRVAALQSIVERAASKPEALEEYLRHRWLDQTTNISYRSEVIPDKFGGPLKVPYKNFEGETRHYTTKMRQVPAKGEKQPSGKGKRTGAGSITEVDGQAGIREASHNLWITGYTNTNWNALNRERFESFVNKQKMDGTLDQHVVVSGTFVTAATEIENGDWLDPSHIFDWATEVKKHKLARLSATGEKRTSISLEYPVWTFAHNFAYPTEVEDIDTEAPILFCDPDSRYPYGLIEEKMPGVQIAELTPNRINKFKRLFPDAKEVAEVIRAMAIKWRDNLTQDDREAIAYNDEEPFDLEWIDSEPEAILDPELRKLIALRQAKSEDVDTRLRDYLPYGESQELENTEASVATEEMVERLEQRYPLLVKVSAYRTSDTFLDHALSYVNMAYTQVVQQRRNK
jgi:hypothetical protein